MIDMTIDEAIVKYKEIANTDANCPIHCMRSCDKCVQESGQISKWLEKLKTVENIMLIYNANWYADEDNGVPDCEVLESIWNVIQDNGLDIDIEQDYRKGKADGYNKALDDFVRFASDMPTVEEEDGTIRPMWLEEMAEKLRAGVKE